MAPTNSVFWRMNKALTCTVPGCDKHRGSQGPYCPAHRARWILYGEPTAGKAVRLYLLKGCLSEIDELLDLNPNHPGYALAESWFKARIRLAKESDFKFADCYRMMERSHPLRTFIVRLGALYLFYKRELDRGSFYTFTKHEFSLYTNVGSMLLVGLRFKSQGLKRPRTEALKFLGKAIHKDLGVFFLTLARAVDRRAEEKIERLSQLGASWEPEESVEEKPKTKPQTKPKRPPFSLKLPDGSVRLFQDPHDPDAKPFTLSALALKYGMTRFVVYGRIRQGWSLERALCEPVQKIKKKEDPDY